MNEKSLLIERHSLDRQYDILISDDRYFKVMTAIQNEEYVSIKDRNWYNRRKKKCGIIHDHLKENAIALKIIRREEINMNDCSICFDLIRKTHPEHLYNPKQGSSPVFLVRAVRLSLVERYRELVSNFPIRMGYRDDGTIFQCYPDNRIILIRADGHEAQFTEY